MITIDGVSPVQGELIDVIERNVETAAVYIYKGRGEMKQAAIYNSSARKVCSLITSSSSSFSSFTQHSNDNTQVAAIALGP